MTQQALATTKQNKQLNVVEGGFQKNSIAKLNMRELKELAEVFVTSKMFPDVQQTAQAMVKIIAGQELGFEPIVSMTGIHIFQGKVSIGANLLASLIKDSGKYQYKITQHDNNVCTAVFYQDVKGEWKQLGVPVSYTIADARDAGLLSKDVWKKYPADMLFASVIRKGCRRYCADVLRGTVSDHDVADEAEADARLIETAKVADEVAEIAHQQPEYAGSDLSEPATEPIDAEPVIDPVESRREDLLTAAKESYKGLSRADKKQTDEWLGQRVLADLSDEDLVNFIEQYQ